MLSEPIGNFQKKHRITALFPLQGMEGKINQRRKRKRMLWTSWDDSVSVMFGESTRGKGSRAV
jgi:hypothetical protein